VSAVAFNQTWDSEDFDGDDFAYSAGDHFIVNRTGLYHLSYGVYTNRTATSTTTRSSYSAQLLVNSVSQNVCRAQGYNRGDGGTNIYDSKEGGAEASCFIELSAGDSVGLQVVRSSSSGDDIWTTPGSVWLAVQSMDYGADVPLVENPAINTSTPAEVYSLVTVNASITDVDSGMGSVRIEITYPNSTTENVTTNQFGSEYYNSSINLTKLGNYSFRFLANDSVGFENHTELALTTNGTTQLTVVDRTAPDLGTRAINESGSIPLNSLVCLNVTGVSDGFSLNEVWAEYTNANGLRANTTMSNSTSCSGATSSDTYAVVVNVGSVTGTFTYHGAHANDSSNNVGSSMGDQALTITFAPDTVPPELTINTPQNTTYGVGSIDYDITVNEKLDISLVSIDGGGNMTLVNDSTFHWYNTSGTHPSLTEGVHTATFFANDTAGNDGFKSVNFTIDLTPPRRNSTSQYLCSHNAQLLEPFHSSARANQYTLRLHST